MQIKSSAHAINEENMSLRPISQVKKRANESVSLQLQALQRSSIAKALSLPFAWFSLAARASYINPPVRGMTGLVTRLLNTPHSRVMHSLFASLTRKLARAQSEQGARGDSGNINAHTPQPPRRPEINGAFYFAWPEH
jgi:hypothetical protein